MCRLTYDLPVFVSSWEWYSVFFFFFLTGVNDFDNDRDYILGTWYSLFNLLWWLLDQEVINRSTFSAWLLFHWLTFTLICLWAAIYRWQQAVPANMAMVKKMFMLLNFAYTLLVLNYSCVGFMVSLKFNAIFFFSFLLRNTFSPTS